MNVETCRLIFRGEELNRLILRPQGETRSKLIFFHGQGDYSERYVEVLRPLVERGLLCILTDLPGHGRSGGIRGGVPGYEFVDALYEESLARIKGMGRGDERIGVGGHSMGGHLALRLLLNHPGRHPFAWVSSPLLVLRQSPLEIGVVKVLASFLPRMTWHTGVKREDCRVENPSSPVSQKSGEEERLHHSRIGLSWASDLEEMLSLVDSALLVRELHSRILITQGTRDPVCSPEVLVDRVARMATLVRLELIAGALHEPFVGETAEVLGRHLLDFFEQEAGLSV